MKSRNNNQRLRAERARRHNESRMIDSIDGSKKAGKQSNGEKAVSKKPVVPAAVPKERPYDRLLRRLRESNSN